MRPLHLSLTDFAAYHSLELPLEDVTFASISGENGSGKSRLLIAIKVALFGTRGTPSGIDLDDLIRTGADLWRDVLVFSAAGASYRVTRENNKRGQSASLDRLDADSDAWVPVCEVGPTNVDAAIVGIIGCSAADFDLVHHIGQGQLGAFPATESGKRKAWLTDNLPMQEIIGYETAAKAAAKTAGEAADRIDAQLGEAKAGLADFDAVALKVAIARDRAHLLELAQADALTRKQLDTANAHNEAARAAQTAYDAASTAYREARDNSMRIKSEINAAEATIVEVAITVTSEPDTTAAVETLRKAEAKAAEVSAAQTRMDDAERALATADAAYIDSDRHKDRCAIAVDKATEATRVLTPDANCPTCGQTVAGPAFETAKRTLDDAATLAGETFVKAREAFIAANDARAHARRHCDDATAALKDVVSGFDANAVTIAHAALEAIVAESRQWRAQQDAEQVNATARETVGRLNARYSDAQTAEQAARVRYDAAGDARREPIPTTDHEVSLKAIGEQTRETERGIVRAEEVLRAHEQRRERADTLATALATARHDATIAAMLAKAYGKAGIQARMIEGAVQQIEDEANAFLGMFTDGLAIEMTTQRENKGGGVREALDIFVIDSLGKRKYEVFSGGEKTRVNVALTIGLMRFLGGSIDSFSIDEPDALDDAGLGELIKCLHKIAAFTGNVMLVSHSKSLLAAMPQSLRVSKTADGSAVEVTL